jgi:hypothetical protein
MAYLFPFFHWSTTDMLKGSTAQDEAKPAGHFLIGKELT